MFFEYGPKNKGAVTWNNNESKIRKWMLGQTGMPINDALMREMNETGYMSNRGR